MRIICDMDEVLVQFVKKILDRWNDLKGTNFTREDINQWGLEHVLGPDAVGIIDQWLGEPGFYEDMEPIENAVPGLQRLMDNGHDIVICTSIPEIALNAFDGKRKWMRKHFPKFSMKSFIGSSRKGLVSGDIIIDDGGHNITDWCSSGKLGAFVMDAPWNKEIGERMPSDPARAFDPQEVREFVHGVPITRVYDWNNILYEVERFAKERYERRLRTADGIIQ